MSEQLTKVCFKCGKNLPLEMFYRHPQMGDGHLNKCKECTKKDVHETYQKNKENPEYMEHERARGRDKYERLYGNFNPAVIHTMSRKRICDAYLTGRSSRRKVQYRFMVRGIEFRKEYRVHHWNYMCPDSVFVIPDWLHTSLHHRVRYSPENNCFMDNQTGMLIDTKEKHRELLFEIAPGAQFYDCELDKNTITLWTSVASIEYS